MAAIDAKHHEENRVLTRPLHDGTQEIFRFPNGYGASVVQHKFSYGGDRGRYELAVIDTFDADNEIGFDWAISYDTWITDDVLGHLTPEQVLETLDDISELPSLLED